jgi:hypothetical protein
MSLWLATVFSFTCSCTSISKNTFCNFKPRVPGLMFAYHKQFMFPLVLFPKEIYVISLYLYQTLTFALLII